MLKLPPGVTVKPLVKKHRNSRSFLIKYLENQAGYFNNDPNSTGRKGFTIENNSFSLSAFYRGQRIKFGDNDSDTIVSGPENQFIDTINNLIELVKSGYFDEQLASILQKHPVIRS